MRKSFKCLVLGRPMGHFNTSLKYQTLDLYQCNVNDWIQDPYSKFKEAITAIEESGEDYWCFIEEEEKDDYVLVVHSIHILI